MTRSERQYKQVAAVMALAVQTHHPISTNARQLLANLHIHHARPTDASTGDDDARVFARSCATAPARRINNLFENALTAWENDTPEGVPPPAPTGNRPGATVALPLTPTIIARSTLGVE